MAQYTVGLWVPTRSSLSTISIEHPGMWMESLKADFLANLALNTDYKVIDDLDFRRGHIRNGDVYIGDINFADIDVYFWFGELDRRHTSYHIDVLEAIGQKTRVVNDATALRIALDKLITQLCLSRHGIPVPEFLAVSRDNVYDVRDIVERKPYIIKPRLGSFGVGITRVTSFDQLVDLIDYSEHTAHFLEEFIESSQEGFIGINVIGGTVVSSYGKEPGSFRGWKVFDRERRGGHMVLRVPSPEQERIALDVARVTGLDILGVDIIQSVTGQNYVIDVNTFPGLYPDLNRQFGSDVAQLCVEVIEQKLEPERVAIAP
jgi:glutathione synthase/RimK-type ligase-like ATP-grasp enzyme